jgi:hypothetical protein
MTFLATRADGGGGAQKIDRTDSGRRFTKAAKVIEWDLDEDEVMCRASTYGAFKIL